MLRFFFKSCSALALALLIYFVVFQQACSQVSWMAGAGCETLSPDSNCQKEHIIPEIPERQSPRAQEATDDYERAERPPARPVTPRCRFSYDLSLGKVDILFVIDNSSSMAEEHRSLAKQFDKFLKHIKNADYNIAVITTDISQSPENPNRGAYYQDGQFISINGQLFLSNPEIGENPDSSIVEAFTTAIEREETRQCDKLAQSSSESEDSSQNSTPDKYQNFQQSPQETNSCPSSDERGTFALNRAFQNPQHRAFFREGSQMMVVFLSDEDVRSGEEFYNQQGFDDYMPEYEDSPESVLRSFYELFSYSAEKRIRFHSIIIPPGDDRCLEQQNENRNQGDGSGRGYYGREYARLSRPDPKLRKFLFENNFPGDNLLDGSVISICDRNYGSQLNNVAISATEMQAPLLCQEPEHIRLFVDNREVRDVEYTTDGNTLFVQPNRDLNLSSRVKIVIVCEGEEVCAD